MIVLKMFKEKINKEIAEASAIDASFYLCIQLIDSSFCSNSMTNECGWPLAITLLCQHYL